MKIELFIKGLTLIKAFFGNTKVKIEYFNGDDFIHIAVPLEGDTEALTEKYNKYIESWVSDSSLSPDALSLVRFTWCAPFADDGIDYTVDSLLNILILIKDFLCPNLAIVKKEDPELKQSYLEFNVPIYGKKLFYKNYKKYTEKAKYHSLYRVSFTLEG